MEAVVIVPFVISVLSFFFLRRIRQAKVKTVDISQKPHISELPKRKISKRLSRTIIAIIAVFLLLAFLYSIVLTSSPPPPLQPSLSVLPDPLNINFGSMSAGNSASQTFLISNSGGGTLRWNVCSDQSWITLSPTSGTNSGVVTIFINTTGLNSGNYKGNITVTSNGGTKSGIILLNIAATPTTPIPTMPTPQTGSISVDSSPSGASIYIDGNYKGQTPTTLTDIAEGSHTITLKLTDYQDLSQNINVFAGQTSSISISLRELSPVPSATPPAPMQSASNLMVFLIFLFILLLSVIFFSRYKKGARKKPKGTEAGDIDVEISGKRLKVEGALSKEQEQLVKDYLTTVGEAPEVNSLTIPTKIYEGDSNIVLLRLATHDALVPNGMPKAMFFIDKQGVKQPCKIEIPSGFIPKSIEIELLAVGFDVEGERRQKHEIFYAPMIYQWNISPTRSGNLEIGLVFRAEDASGRIGELGVITHKINVVKILGLTGQQIGTLTNIFGAVGGVLGVVVTLNQLGILNFK